jgi:glycine/D-amino acid oxidase-like deaminating enzyme
MNRDYIDTEQGVTGVAGSVWLASNAEEYPTLDGDQTADVVVVGGGITGALVARKLSEGGRHVILLDRRRIASGTTGHSTAKVTALHGDSWRVLVGQIEGDEVRSWASANLAAVDELATIAGSLGVECGLRRVPAFLVAGDDATGADFDEHLSALVSAGLPATATMAPHPFGRPAAAIAEQALIDPGAFVVAVIAALGSNAKVFESSPVRSLDRVGDGWHAVSDHGSVSARVAIMADHFPTHDTGGFFTRLFPYAHYALEIAPREIMPDGMWMQVGGEELTLRPTSDAQGTWIASGHRSVRVASVDDEREVYASLSASVARLLGECDVIRHWSAHDHETPDGLPFIGEAPLGRNLFMAAGYAGWGMTKSVVASSIIADAVEGRVHPLAETVSPSRVPKANSAGSLISENATVGRAFVAGHLTSRRDKAHQDSVAGSTCTHLGCETKWNTAEGTVDCPCHGSRYGRHGDVIYGPASRDIES